MRDALGATRAVSSRQLPLLIGHPEFYPRHDFFILAQIARHSREYALIGISNALKKALSDIDFSAASRYGRKVSGGDAVRE